MSETHPESKNNPTRMTGTRTYVILGVCLLVIAAAIVWSFARRGPDVGNQAGAIRTCEAGVKDRLKSPGTAKFPEQMTTNVTGTYWVVKGPVDAQNGFGGIVRNTYRCELIYGGDDIWKMNNMQMSSD